MQSKTMALVQWKLLYNILSLFSAALLLLVNQEIDLLISIYCYRLDCDSKSLIEVFI